jgi:magnesium chelatase subunit H
VAVSLYNATSLREDADWRRLEQEVATADFVFGTMLFGEEYVRPLLRVLQSSRCPVCVITSNPALIRSTHLGKFDLRVRETAANPSPLMAWARKFRP